MIDREPAVSDEQCIRFRVGVNLGDVIVEEHDIFGDGVNVAARLEALAEPGGICITRTVREQIRDKLPYPFADRGEQNIKNIARPVRVYEMLPEAVANLPATGARPAMSFSRPTSAPRLSIIVLPFVNLSNDPEQEYFADGITDDVTTDLSRIDGSFVIACSTASTYKGKSVDVRQIGRELGVRYVLEGTVRRSRSEIRLNAQLIDAETEAHLWAERFTGDASDLFALQDEITNRIAVALDLELVDAEAARPNEHPDALDYILRGRAERLKPPSRETRGKAVSLFERALALDQKSVAAQGWLAIELTARALDFMTDTAAADIVRAESLAERALAASPRNPLTRFAKGQVLRAQDRYEEAIPEYESAIAVNRNWAYAYSHLGWCKFVTGSIEELIPTQERAIRLSPRDPQIGLFYFRIGFAYLLQSRTDAAIVWCERARNAAPGHPLFRALLASAYALKGEIERAVAEITEARRLVGDDRYSSIARLRAVVSWGAPKDLVETTYFAGLRKAGVPEE
jgi:TolB-like protein/Flp pilus assembly protein TadD